MNIEEYNRNAHEEPVTKYPPVINEPSEIRIFFCMLGFHHYVYIDHIATGLRECTICKKRK